MANKKRLSFIIALALLAIIPACAQRSSSSEHSFHKAVEAYYEDDDQNKALELVNKILNDNPDHLDARYLRSNIYWNNDKYDAAIRDVTYAIKNYKGEPDVYKSTLYGLRGAIYSDLERHADAAKDYQMAAKLARKDNPEHVQSYAFDYAQALYNNDDLDGAEKIYFQMLKDDPGDCAAMIGLARNYMDEERYDEAMKYIEQAESYDASYSQIYRFKMQVLDKMGKTDESVEAALKYYETDDDPHISAIVHYAGKHYTYAVAKIKAEMNKQDGGNSWIPLLIELYENNHYFAQAVELYDKVESDYGVNEKLCYFRARCYRELGEYDNAIDDISRAIGMNPDEEALFSSRADLYRSAGMYDKAIADYTACIEKDPSYGKYYYARGRCYASCGDGERAMEDYNTGIDLEKDYSPLYLRRGIEYTKQGKTELAKADYEMVLKIDTVAVYGSNRHYALHALGRDEEAIEWSDRVIANEPDKYEAIYDKACLCALTGRKDMAIESLRSAFEKGYRKFIHLENDEDLDSIRDLPEFKTLVGQYKRKKVEVDSDESVVAPQAVETLVSEVHIKKTPGGTYEVPCSINGLPLKFIFDTGASDVTISSVEASFMLKNDYLSTKDFRGSRKYLTADGNIAEGSVICIREVQVGDVTLKNIEASVVKNQKAPLLLGQSVLERFGSFTLDNDNSKLIIKHKQ